ncbi:MAG: antitoxin Xre/MbcA/ParS toxin-binding domain-containing protein [Armatimonadota bacterium]
MSVEKLARQFPEDLWRKEYEKCAVRLARSKRQPADLLPDLPVPDDIRTILLAVWKADSRGWLQRKKKFYGGVRPIDLLDTEEGWRAVKAMLLRSYKIGYGINWPLAFGITGVVHFTIALVIWGLFLKALSPVDDWGYVYRHLVPCVVFLCLFITGTIVILKKWRHARLLLGIAFACALGLFIHDAATHDYQLQAMTFENGCVHYYFTWWWFNDCWVPGR